jgi:hypothetical protein
MQSAEVIPFAAAVLLAAGIMTLTRGTGHAQPAAISTNQIMDMKDFKKPDEA